MVQEVVAGFPTERDVDVDLEPGLTPLMADRDMVVQILTNLVSNALKYSPPHTAVSVRARRNDATVEVAVEDLGIGVTDDEAGRIFGKSFRVDRDEVREAGGTGLGLYITGQLLERQEAGSRCGASLGAEAPSCFGLPAASEQAARAS